MMKMKLERLLLTASTNCKEQLATPEDVKMNRDVQQMLLGAQSYSGYSTY